MPALPSSVRLSNSTRDRAYLWRIPVLCVLSVCMMSRLLGQEAQQDKDIYARGVTDGRRDGLIYGTGAVALVVVAFLLWRRLSIPSSPQTSVTSPDRPTKESPNPPIEHGMPLTIKKRSVFISYRREDSADITGRITDRLIQKFGRDAVFKDVDSIPLGMDFRKHLHEAVSRCDALLVVIGRNWRGPQTDGKRRIDDARDHLRIEVEAALQRDIPVIPVLVQGASIPDEQELPESLQTLAYRHALAVRPDPDFNGDADRLVRGIESYLKSPTPS